ncbi:MAG TPA: bifunctional alpha,alpha-trehalose-phosphate synthase (UDP-forming)/trehalose-phosphatase [Candidatus Dormibacteraeota bacterium]|nr:bifunctional alpha,alpha-trehalose-phosphate synthase (UDP-forming)/trehalose-phosphatase [Candidatus Dormibacteraeota bacterium]
MRASDWDTAVGRPSGRQRLVVVSNRLPVTAERTDDGLVLHRSAGGLVSALDPVLGRRGGTWVGWPGIPFEPGERLPAHDQAYALAPVPMRAPEVSGFYHGFANGTLWPLFHSFPQRTRFDARTWRTYRGMNERFARVADEAAAADDLIWVHDYQLMLTPLSLRERRPGARIAFFLHIPFPSFDLYRLLPWDRELLYGLLACDVIGFHVEGYERNFLDCAERLLGARVDRAAHLIEHGGRTVRVGAFPLGIDFSAYEGRARRAPAAVAEGPRVVLGVDRLDYTKGIPERLRAFERLLELHPEHHERVILLQIAVPSRSEVEAYRRQKRQIDELVGRVNGRFGTPHWTPIHYLHRGTEPDDLVQLYRDADVALVTPLRDGMNLVAKEYVACQIGDPGVLVLSRFAGASETMREALRVNPYNVDATAEAIHRALTMEEPERRSRMAALRWRERRHDVVAWLDDFVSVAAAPPTDIRPPTAGDFETWLAPRLGEQGVALLLDYDGTLAAICDHPAEAQPTPRMRAALMACLARDDTRVAVVSGRSLADLRQIFPLPGLTLAANHGLEIGGTGAPSFRHPDLVHFAGKLAALADELECALGPGAWVERKGATLTVHVRGVAAAERAPLVERVKRTIGAAGFQARDGLCAVEARPPIGWDKGQAALHILRQWYGPAWSERVRVVYAGDDQTDEDAFRVLAGLGVTFRIGGADSVTLADRRLSNLDAVEALLSWLAQRPPAVLAVAAEPPSLEPTSGSARNNGFASPAPNVA